MNDAWQHDPISSNPPLPVGRKGSIGIFSAGVTTQLLSAGVIKSHEVTVSMQTADCRCDTESPSLLTVWMTCPLASVPLVFLVSPQGGDTILEVALQRPAVATYMVEPWPSSPRKDALLGSLVPVEHESGVSSVGGVTVPEPPYSLDISSRARVRRHVPRPAGAGVLKWRVVQQIHRLRVSSLGIVVDDSRAAKL